MNTQLIHNLTSHADGIETDNTGLLYLGAPEDNGIWTLNQATGAYQVLVRNDKIQWPVSRSRTNFTLHTFVTSGGILR